MNPVMVIFRIGAEPAALRLEDVAAVHEPVPVAPVAGFADAVCGLATVSGEVVTVIDPARLLAGHSPATVPDAAGLLLLLDGEARGVALALDGPVQVRAAGTGRSLDTSGALAPLCRTACTGADGTPTGIVEPGRVLALASRDGCR
ncbi:MAG: chemotaxis protein CheW [Acidobacteriota bacterium]